MNETSKYEENEPQLEPMPEIEPQPKVEMPEDFVEPKGKASKWGEVVENKELGVRYREKVIELPKHRQEETGIKRIRRRELLPPFPEGIKMSEEDEKTWYRRGYNFERGNNRDVLDFLTDNRFPSEKNWHHTLMGDLKHSEELFYGLAKKHGKELVYFQEIAPLDVDLKVSHGSRLYNYWRFFQKRDNVVEKIEPPRTDEERKKSISYYNMSVGSSSSPWIDPIQTPIYIFGNRNRAFVNYIDKIVKNPDVRKALELMGWVHKQEDDLSRVENVFKDEGDSWTKTSPRKNLTKLEKFAEGLTIKDDLLTGHPFIPIIRHPDIPKFRWCFAEMAIIPTKRSLNVLFFETGDEDKNDKE